MEDKEMDDSDDVGQTLEGSNGFTSGVQSRSQKFYVVVNSYWSIVAVAVIALAIVISFHIPNHTKDYLDDIEGNTVQDNDKQVKCGSGIGRLNNKKIEYLRTIVVRSNQDSSTPYVTGLGIVSASSMVVVDFTNRKVKHLDTKLDQITSELNFDTEPWDVSIIDAHKAAVTLPFTDTIQYVTISDSKTLSVGQQIKTRGKCCGIAYWDEKLAVTRQFTTGGHWSLDILDMSGNVLNSITPEHSGQLLFGTPLYVTVTNDEDLYVSDSKHKAVYRLNVHGEVKAVYKHSDVRGSAGLTVGPCGTMYVCDQSSHNVYQLDPNGDGVQKVLGTEIKVQEPRSVSYSGNKLYVGTLTGKVRVFHWK